MGSFSETAAFAEVVVLAVKGSAAADALRAAGSKNLDGKLVIDACNPIADAPPINGVLKFFTSLDESLMERLQREFPKAHLVKAFNSVGNASIRESAIQERKPTMFICGNDDGAKSDGCADSRTVRLGDGGHGQGGSGARHRTAVHVVVHPGIYEERVDARVQAAAAVAEPLELSFRRLSQPHRPARYGRETAFAVY